MRQFETSIQNFLVLDLQTMKETLSNQFSGVRLGQASIR